MTGRETNFAANPAERLLAPALRAMTRRQARFGVILLICLLIHVGVLLFLFIEDALTSRQAEPAQETAVEVVTEPPPEAKQEPPPAQKESPPQEEKKPEPEKKPETAPLDEKPATDAPRAPNKETQKQEAPDEATKAPTVAKPLLERLMTPTPAEPKAAPGQPQPLPEEASRAPDEDRPDAETIDEATPKPQPKPDKKQAQPDKKAPPGDGGKSIADMVAALEPLPKYQFSGISKPSPVTGGNAETTYLTILYGLIMPKYHAPPQSSLRSRLGKGVITFYIDPRGNLVHQAVRQSSGLPEVDAAALSAVRKAAPFPPPPTTLPVGIRWEY
jgi:TonB family protein